MFALVLKRKVYKFMENVSWTFIVVLTVAIGLWPLSHFASKWITAKVTFIGSVLLCVFFIVWGLLNPGKLYVSLLAAALAASLALKGYRGKFAETGSERNSSSDTAAT